MSYTTEEIKLINKTTTKFYSEVADSFSKTRQKEWEGWNQCLKYFKDGDKVLDLGCGNCRFSKFLFENKIKPERVDCMDNLKFNLPRSPRSIDSVYLLDFYEIDIIDSLLEDKFNLESYDVAVCFGVMHHIPTAELREKLLCELTKSKIAIVSFWQFEKDNRIFCKAQETTKLAQKKLGLQNLEAGDYFLGWQDQSDVYRFCHNFTNAEVESIASEFNATDSFTADKLNKYLVLCN